MFRLCIVLLLLLSPAVAVRDFHDSEKMEVLGGAAKAASGAEFSDDWLTLEMMNGQPATTPNPVSDHEAIGFGQFLQCVCFLKDHQSLKVVDLNRPWANDGYGKEISITNCGSQCLDRCKNGDQGWLNKFVMFPDEHAAIGVEGVHKRMVAAKCGGPEHSDCECLNPTKTAANVEKANAQFGVHIDAARPQQVLFATVKECMQGCQCMDYGGAMYEGLCMDERYPGEDI